MYLDGTYSEVYPHIALGLDGLTALVRQFSTPGGVPSHVSVQMPGSLHEGMVRWLAIILRTRVRMVNVVDLMALLPADDHPHGFSEQAFEAMFTADTDLVFAFHGYPRAVHELLHGRTDPGRFHVRGFTEQGTTTTP